MTPKRIQMSRQHPWRAENPDAVVVARPSKWGNPVRVGDRWCGIPIQTSQDAVSAFRSLMDANPTYAAEAALELRGRDLACWCPLDRPCHADVLIELANPTT
jgi:hypothetical protein